VETKFAVNIQAMLKFGDLLDNTGVIPAQKPRKRAACLRTRTHLERIKQIVDVEDKACPCCGGAIHQIGEDVNERLDVVPHHLPRAGHPAPALWLPLMRKRSGSVSGASTDR